MAHPKYGRHFHGVDDFQVDCRDLYDLGLSDEFIGIEEFNCDAAGIDTKYSSTLNRSQQYETP